MNPEFIDLYCPFCEEVTQFEADDSGAECLTCRYNMDITELDTAIKEKEESRLDAVGKYLSRQD